MKSGNVLLGVLAGVAAGALLGVLFAPEKGTRTRRKIAYMGSEASDELKEKFDNLLEGITEKFETVKAEVCDLYEKGKSNLGNMKKDVKS